MKHCEDCGTVLEKNGVCSNCHEEAFIFEHQMPEDPVPVSKEFKEKVDAQKAEIKRKKNVS